MKIEHKIYLVLLPTLAFSQVLKFSRDDSQIKSLLDDIYESRDTDGKNTCGYEVCIIIMYDSRECCVRFVYS